MKQYYQFDEWNIIENSFDAHYHEISESICSIGNGYMGQRANFEEQYSGKTLQGSYMAGVYYPDKTRVGWWKNGYPEYFAKVLNSTNWIGININIDGEALDLANAEIGSFSRVLNMKEGTLTRSFTASLANGKQVKVDAIRICSYADKEIGAIRYAITVLNGDAELTINPYLDGDIKNKDSNYDEKFWDAVDSSNTADLATLTIRTRKTGFVYTSAMKFQITQSGQPLSLSPIIENKTKFVGHTVTVSAKANQTTVIEKIVSNVTSRDHNEASLVSVATELLNNAFERGFDTLLAAHIAVWANKWNESDIIVDGDVAAQQGIRFNIFHMHQTYNGEDSRLNIGPKGFTGEKYGGSTYWDTEAYCLPFYLSTADQKIARQLLVYRHNQLERAKENAKKLGFTKGALYPMVTMNGEECHNEWEITFEEIHRNGAIAYAVLDYVRYTGDTSVISEFAIETVYEIARFWEDRVHWAARKGQYVMLGVTGPNEYENNVNNNWYTNRVATWTLEYALELVNFLKTNEPGAYTIWEKQLGITQTELSKWQHIIDNMYFPYDEELGVYLQQDGFLDKELIQVKDLDPSQLPLNQKWSWDRILRSCFIKQADVLQGLFFLGDRYDLETKKRNFDFYEPMTVHESSLSPCVHSILACELGYNEKAYEMYLRTSRLDLDNYNNDTEDGLHITSMAGTWMSVIKGFAGLKIESSTLSFNPFIPEEWKSFSFKVMFRGALLNVQVGANSTHITNESDHAVQVILSGKRIEIPAKQKTTV